MEVRVYDKEIMNVVYQDVMKMFKAYRPPDDSYKTSVLEALKQLNGAPFHVIYNERSTKQIDALHAAWSWLRLGNVQGVVATTFGSIITDDTVQNLVAVLADLADCPVGTLREKFQRPITCYHVFPEERSIEEDMGEMSLDH